MIAMDDRLRKRWKCRVPLPRALSSWRFWANNELPSRVESFQESWLRSSLVQGKLWVRPGWRNYYATYTVGYPRLDQLHLASLWCQHTCYCKCDRHGQLGSRLLILYSIVHKRMGVLLFKICHGRWQQRITAHHSTRISSPCPRWSCSIRHTQLAICRTDTPTSPPETLRVVMSSRR